LIPLRSLALYLYDLKHQLACLQILLSVSRSLVATIAHLCSLESNTANLGSVGQSFIDCLYKKYLDSMPIKTFLLPGSAGLLRVHLPGGADEETALATGMTAGLAYSAWELGESPADYPVDLIARQPLASASAEQPAKLKFVF
jgi:hypothetical protein